MLLSGKQSFFLLILKNFIVDVLDGFSIAHGTISAIQGSLYTIAQLPANRTIRLGLAGGVGILFGIKNIIWPSYEGEDDSPQKKTANLTLSVLTFLLFYTEFITGIMSIKDTDFKMIMYPFLAFSSLCAIMYSIGRHCLSDEQKCCLELEYQAYEAYREDANRRSQLGAASVFDVDEQTPLRRGVEHVSTPSLERSPQNQGESVDTSAGFNPLKSGESYGTHIPRYSPTLFNTNEVVPQENKIAEEIIDNNENLSPVSKKTSSSSSCSPGD